MPRTYRRALQGIGTLLTIGVACSVSAPAPHSPTLGPIRVLEEVEALVLAGTDNAPILNAHRFLVDAKGIAIPDVIGNHVFVFDKSGALQRVLGGSGSGPGEFRGPATLARDPSGRLHVFDLGTRRVQVFRADGEIAETYRISGQVEQLSFSDHSQTDGLIVSGLAPCTDVQGSCLVRHTHSDGSILATLIPTQLIAPSMMSSYVVAAHPQYGYAVANLILPYVYFFDPDGALDTVLTIEDDAWRQFNQERFLNPDGIPTRAEEALRAFRDDTYSEIQTLAWFGDCLAAQSQLKNPAAGGPDIHYFRVLCPKSDTGSPPIQVPGILQAILGPDFFFARYENFGDSGRVQLYRMREVTN